MNHLTELDKADAAIDFIDCLPKRISLILIQGAHNHNLDVTKLDANKAMQQISEILGDLFYKDRLRLTKIAGWQDKDTSYGENLQVGHNND